MMHIGAKSSTSIGTKGELARKGEGEGRTRIERGDGGRGGIRPPTMWSDAQRKREVS